MAYTTINKSTDYFNTKLYTGNESTRSETGVGFQPDFTWIKVRSRADPHILTDAVRGTSSQLSSDTTGAQQTFSNMITSFNSDGFSLGANVDVNRNSETFASWNWKANGSGSANTDGSINSTVSANTTSGFSIVSYSGNASNSTVGHGLGVAPDFIIIKSRTEGRSWVTGNSTSGWTKWLALESTDAESTASSIWNDTAPTNQVFSVGTSSALNNNGQNFIAYCFAQKTGYSKFGSYTGNGSTDGTFVYTGFKPAFVMFKRTNSTGNWQLLDNKRLGYNPENRTFYPNSNIAEQNEDDADLLSNGFKLKSTGGDSNISGGQYIYMAFGQSIVGSNNIPATAR